MAIKGAIYTDSYFKFLFILMKYGADVFRRRIRAKIFLFLQYEQVKLAIINDKKRNRLLIYVYYKGLEEKDLFEYVGQVNIYFVSDLLPVLNVSVIVCLFVLLQDFYCLITLIL